MPLVFLEGLALNTDEIYTIKRLRDTTTTHRGDDSLKTNYIVYLKAHFGCPPNSPEREATRIFISQKEYEYLAFSVKQSPLVKSSNGAAKKKK